MKDTEEKLDALLAVYELSAGDGTPWILNDGDSEHGMWYAMHNDAVAVETMCPEYADFIIDARRYYPKALKALQRILKSCTASEFGAMDSVYVFNLRDIIAEHMMSEDEDETPTRIDKIAAILKREGWDENEPPTLANAISAACYLRDELKSAHDNYARSIEDTKTARAEVKRLKDALVATGVDATIVDAIASGKEP